MVRSLIRNRTEATETLEILQPGKRHAQQLPADLAAVVAKWDELPPAIRAGILAMVQAAG